MSQNPCEELHDTLSKELAELRVLALPGDEQIILLVRRMAGPDRLGDPRYEAIVQNDYGYGRAGHVVGLDHGGFKSTAPFQGGSYPDLITFEMIDARNARQAEAIRRERESMENTEPRVPAHYPILAYFRHDHLPAALAETSKPFFDLAHKLARDLPPGPEVTVALRKLLESKDAAVRSALVLPP